MTVPRISPLQVWARLQTQPPALLVCAYDDEEKCAALKIPGSLLLRSLSSRLGSLPKDQEIIFYCG
jgi:hypothetical protein